MEMKITFARSKPQPTPILTYFDCLWLCNEVVYESLGATLLVNAFTYRKLRVFGVFLCQMNASEFRYWSFIWLASVTTILIYCVNGVNGMLFLLYYMRPEYRHSLRKADATAAILRTVSLAGPGYSRALSQFLPQLISSIWLNYNLLSPMSTCCVGLEKRLTHRRGFKAATLSTYGKYDLTGLRNRVTLSAPSDASCHGLRHMPDGIAM